MRAYLQLFRLPNVFTAIADILLGFLFTHQWLQPWTQLALLVIASSLLYMAGMALNDYFDRQQDARERPFRPIPSGRIAPQLARRIGLAMLVAGAAAGWAAAGLAGEARPGIVATLLAGAILLYDGVVKLSPLGPVMIGACRMLNVLLGMSLASGPWQAAHWVAAGGIGLYIVGVTIFARREARISHRLQLGLGLVVLLAGIGLLASLPAWVTGQEWPEINVPERWYLFWVLIGLLIAGRAVVSIVDPRPALVQTAVRNCIFSLIILDAGACLAVQGYYAAILILALLVPTMTLGRWIYST